MPKEERKNSKDLIKNLERQKKDTAFLLALENHNFSEKSLEAIEKITRKRPYTHINISNINIEDFTPKEFEILGEIIGRNKELKEIIFKDNLLSDETVKSFITILQKLEHFITLNTSGCDIGEIGKIMLKTEEKIGFLIENNEESIKTSNVFLKEDEFKDTMNLLLDYTKKNKIGNDIVTIDLTDLILDNKKIKQLISTLKMLENEVSLDISYCNVSYAHFEEIMQCENVKELIMKGHEHFEPLIDKNMLLNNTYLDLLELSNVVIFVRNKPHLYKNFFNSATQPTIDQKNEDMLQLEDMEYDEYSPEKEDFTVQDASPVMDFRARESARAQKRNLVEQSMGHG